MADEPPKLKLRFHDCRVFNYFRRIRSAISFAAFPFRSYNRICDILENLSGVGIRIEKQTKENTHWLLVADEQAGEPEVPDTECETDSSAPGKSVERYAGGPSNPNTGALQLYNFPVNTRWSPPTNVDWSTLFDVVVRRRTTATLQRPEVAYIDPAKLLPSGGWSAVDGMRIKDSESGGVTSTWLEYHLQPYKFNAVGVVVADGEGQWKHLLEIERCGGSSAT